MNKKGQMEIAIFMIGVVLLVWYIGISIENTNPYNTFMKDCKEVNRDNFGNSSCISFECIRESNKALNEFCYYEWMNKEEKQDE